MSESFISIAEAVQLTGKSRRTILRLVTRLAKEQPDQVMREKTVRGWIWKISRQSVEQAYGVAQSLPNDITPVPQPPVPAPADVSPSKQYLEVALQGYRGMMAMHQEVKQVYEERLRDKDQQIDRLMQELELAKRELIPAPETEQSRKGLWGWLFGS